MNEAGTYGYKQAEPNERTGARICIVARKDLTHNTRVARQTKALEDAGYRVTVVSICTPNEDLMAQTPNARFIAVKPQPKLQTWLASQAVKDRLGATARQKEKFRYNAWLKKAEQAEADGTTVEPFAPAEPMPFGRKVLRHLAHSSVLTLMRITKLGPVTPADRSWLNENGTYQAVREMVAAAMPVLITQDFALKAAEAVADQTFDLVQPHDSMALPAAGLIADRLKCPILYDAVEIPDDRSGWSLQRTPQWLLKHEARQDAKVIRKARKIITVSNGLADWMVTRYKIERPELIRNCRYYVDIEPGDRTIRADAGIPDGEKLVLYLNSLYPGQGLEQLVDSLAHLPNDVHIATLGPIAKQGYVDGLFDQAKALGVSARFHILEPKPPAEMLQYASGADIGVIPRQNTSFNNYISLPNRVFELVMSRLPIAAPSLPDMKRFVAENQIGESFDETDPRDIARVVSEMLEPDNLARYQAAVCEAARQLCWENEGAKYVDLVQETLNRHGQQVPQ